MAYHQATNTKSHIAVCPSPGIGHLSPMLRLTSTLASSPYNLHVTLVITLPIISNAESHEISTFFSTHPHVTRLDFHLPSAPSSSESAAAVIDPFLLQYSAFSTSIHLLGTSLSALTPPISALFSDFLATKGINGSGIARNLGIPNYTVYTTSARFASLMTILPHLPSKISSTNNGYIDIGIPGINSIPIDTIPPPFFNPSHIFTQLLSGSSELLHLSAGILINTFDFFEAETITALVEKSQNDINLLPPVLAIGPLHGPLMVKEGDGDDYHSWLNNQQPQSVVYVSFGSRTAMSREQIQELGIGLGQSGCSFIWVVKTSKVDKEEDKDIMLIKELVGDEFYEKNITSGKGLVLREWVNQEEILAHTSIGGFVSHCGWNSVMEAARHGVPMLAWPQHGDQRVNAEVLEKAGLGIWERDWGWGGERVIKAVEISEKVKELMMVSGKLRKTAGRVREEGKKAWESGGSSSSALMNIIDSLM